ncbi:type II toxin-antitoxin system VapC family toxin [Glycomyces niveus]|uniref:Ribonuclease VapC n=1 Tax=Glycomyces niveus TaxID=2820287 RepID=A0ABS3U897_9ACTN|nr:PIN domain-containing protein [Glycomyces sp. NEAU-S30]MBO3733983.1 PIN domain-containing protein [Glycomyces sp. NEAU-S30]
MIIVADTSALLAVFNPRDPDHGRCAELFNSTSGFVYSPLVFAELDHLIRARVHYGAAKQAYEDLIERVAGVGATDYVGQLSIEDYLSVRELRGKYDDMELDLADCLAVALARDWETNQIFTLDETDFRRLAPLPGGDSGFDFFRILPTDLD